MKVSGLTTLWLALLVTGCSTAIQPTNTDNLSDKSISNSLSSNLSKQDIALLDKEYLSFNTKALSADYFQKKLVNFIANDNGVSNGSKIVKELEYARYKGESVIPFKAMINTSPSFYNSITSIPAVIIQRLPVNSPLDLFLKDGNPYPSAPTATTASSVTSNSFSANWDAVTGATSYEISIDNGTPFNVGNVTSYSVTGLTAGSSHSYVIKAINASGTGPSSNSISVITANDLPDAPIAVAATSITSNSFTANWNEITGATGYSLIVDGGTPIVLGTVTGYSVTGLTAGSSHSYVVKAINASGTGPSSNSIDVTTLDPQGEFRINTYTTNDQINPAIGMNANGIFVTIWQSEGQDGNGRGVYGQRFNSSGVPQS
ncbi:fibronectin type III domain-containing protein, partial [bacterium]